MNPIIKLPEKFSHHQARTLLQENMRDLLAQQPTPSTIEIDFARVIYIDSSALGALIMIKKLAAEAACEIVITNAQGQVLQSILIAKLDRLFKVNP